MISIYEANRCHRFVSARTLAFRGFFIEFILAPFFLSVKYHDLLTPWIRCLNQSDWLPFGEQKGSRICTMDLVCQVYVETSSDDSRVD